MCCFAPARVHTATTSTSTDVAVSPNTITAPHGTHTHTHIRTGNRRAGPTHPADVQWAVVLHS